MLLMQPDRGAIAIRDSIASSADTHGTCAVIQDTLKVFCVVAALTLTDCLVSSSVYISAMGVRPYQLEYQYLITIT